MSEQAVKDVVEALERMMEPSGDTLTTLQVDCLIGDPLGKNLWSTPYWVYQAGHTKGYDDGWSDGYEGEPYPC